MHLRSSGMKYLCALGAAICAASPAAAGITTTTLFEDDFNDGIESFWTLQDLRPAGSPFNWDTNDNVRRDGGFGDLYENYTDGSGLAATASSESAPGNYDIALISPEIQIPENPEQILLTYESNYQNFQNSDFANTDVSTDGGQTWNTILSWNEDHGLLFGVGVVGAEPIGESVELDLTQFAGESIRIRFRYFEPNGGNVSFYWQIDDVRVFVVPSAPTLALVAPAALALTRRRR